MQFDGVYFQSLMRRMTKWSNMDRETAFKPIQPYRIYAWPINALEFFSVQTIELYSLDGYLIDTPLKYEEKWLIRINKVSQEVNLRS